MTYIGSRPSTRSGIWLPETVRRRVAANDWRDPIVATIFAWGGGGGGYGSPSGGGAGGAARGQLELISGQSYLVIVGSGGQSMGANSSPGTQGFGGGGLAPAIGFAGQGGGYSGLFLGSTRSQSTAILIAGGGGGAGAGSSGGGGGGTTGQDGSGPYAGAAGTQSSGGAGGYFQGGSTNGTILQGGRSGATGDSGGGGGGGGGYWGGGSGWNGDSPAGNSGGGGGSSYTHPSLITSGVLTGANGTTPGDSSNSLRSGAGESGTSGRVVIRYPGVTTLASGGTVSNDGSFTYHTFGTAGEFTFALI